MSRYICIHGHFYQPPRENPWLETIEIQQSAYPFHDWNERVTAECYAPNATSRILDDAGFISKIASNYARISFNFGPTLLTWLERERRDVYEAILRADSDSAARFSGHGSALAQAYNHSILPLCTKRDKTTQVRWGIRDFERRFGRKPAGMWLPETAADIETLEVLAGEGITFTLLAPGQAHSYRPRERKDWIEVGDRIDPKQAYTLELPSGERITVLFYDGPVSRAVAFERLLHSGDTFAGRLLGAFENDRDGSQLVHIATDGETYGHHHHHGDMALAYAIARIEDDPGVTLTNYGEFLERVPPTHEARIVENTSWSCAHGIERWRSDCGCKTGGDAQWNQRWRTPLRDALDWLAQELSRIYDNRAPGLLADPWRARDAYIEVVVDPGSASRARFFSQHAARDLTEPERTNALKLLEMQRHQMLMYTSCGWFFDELSGIETTQIIRYAARAIQLAQELTDDDVETPFLERLAEAHSNLPDIGDGKRLYDEHVVPNMVDLPKLVAHYAVSSLFTDYKEEARVFAYTVRRVDRQASKLGRSRIAVGKVDVVSKATGESASLSFGVLHLGDHNLSGGVREFAGEDAYETMRAQVMQAFERADMPEVLRLLDKHFLELTYSMRSLFRDEQRKVLDIIVGSALGDAEALAGQLYDRNSPLLRYLATLDSPLPKALHGLTDFVLSTALSRAFAEPELDLERCRELFAEAQELGSELDTVGLSYTLQRSLEEAATRWSSQPGQLDRLRRVRRGVELASELPFEVDLSRVQNDFYSLMEKIYGHYREQAERGDEAARSWVEEFESVGNQLRIRTSV